MIYGLLGEHLSHSFSKEIHQGFGMHNYALYPMPEKDIGPFLHREDFSGCNVTMPYKREVLKYCDIVSERVKKIGVANTVVKRGSHLYAENTDYHGFLYLLNRSGFRVRDLRCAVLGSGATSCTVQNVLKDQGAGEIFVFSRKGVLAYDDIGKVGDIDILINATPVGMYPNNGETLVNLSEFSNLRIVIDCIYNPLRSRLLLDAKEIGAGYACGLSMLVMQAKAAEELFQNKKIPDETVEKIISDIYCSSANIVLIGMPGSGKTSVGKQICKLSGKKFFDTDALIEQRLRKSIPQIFKDSGEEYFRDIEENIIREISSERGSVISVGGGSILRKVNRTRLQENGKLYYLKRELHLLDKKDRPLSLKCGNLERIFTHRDPIYRKLADKVIENNRDLEDCAKKILEDFHENSCY